MLYDFVHITPFRKGIPFLLSGEMSIYPNTTYRAVAQASGKQILQPGSFVLQAPIYNPEKLICIGMNYVDHCTEQNIPVPEEPVIFSKFNSAITEPNGPVLLSDETQVTVYSIGTTHHAECNTVLWQSGMLVTISNFK